MSNKIQTQQNLSAEVVQRLLFSGDLRALTPEQKMQYHAILCNRLKLDPTGTPFEIIKMKNREVLYLTVAGVQQLIMNHNISLEYRDEKLSDGLLRVFYRARMGERFVDSSGAVSIKGMSGDDLADAYLRCESKAVRRSVLNLIGMGSMDESEPVETSPAQPPQSEEKKSKYETSPRAVHGEAARKSLGEVEKRKFPFGWNKGKTLREVFVEKSETEIANAIKWADENNSYFEWAQHAKRFLELVTSGGKESKKQEPAEVPVEYENEVSDLPF